MLKGKPGCLAQADQIPATHESPGIAPTYSQTLRFPQAMASSMMFEVTSQIFCNLPEPCLLV